MMSFKYYKDLYIDVFKEAIPKWSSLKGLENNKLVKSSFIWFMLVPVFSKLLGKLNETIIVTYNNHDYTLNFSLPFSWQIFFFAACFFTAGSVAVKLFCPNIIKEHTSFINFQESGKGWPQINGYIIDLYYDNFRMLFPEKHLDSVNNYLKYFHNKDFSKSKTYETEVVIFLETNRIGQDENYAYWYTYNGAESVGPIKRVIATIFYFIGFSLLSIVAYQNLLFVIEVSNIFS
jgi:hypothetical protein